MSHTESLETFCTPCAGPCLRAEYRLRGTLDHMRGKVPAALLADAMPAPPPPAPPVPATTPTGTAPEGAQP